MANGGENGRSDDRPRLLSRRSEFGYTDRADRALPGEPEAISSEEQERQSVEARRRERQRRAAAWKPARELISGALATFAPLADRATKSDLRVVQRQLARIDARLRS